MSINYNVIARANPLKREEKPKYYATTNAKGRRNLRFMAKNIAQRSSLNEIEIFGVLEGLVQLIPEILIDGYSVDLGDFGIFSVTCKSQACETPEEVNHTKIEKLNVQFRPGKLMKKAIDDADFTRAVTSVNTETPAEDPAE
jgi:predicted histone-like DNA-binding protein